MSSVLQAVEQEKKQRSFIPFHFPSIAEEEIDLVTQTLRSGWLTSGPKTRQFEEEFQQYVDAPYALALNSCTAGLQLALAALNIGPGDEVITTPLTFCATVNSILHVGATPVLADIGSDGNISPESIRSRITPRTRAIIPVHYAGVPCDMNEIWALAKEHQLFVIEDAAHAVGTHYRGRPIGSSTDPSLPASDVVVFSFYATKNLTTAEGGMVTTGSEELYNRMKRLCLHGISKDAWNRYAENGSWYYEVAEVGFKYNLSDVQSAIGIPQLRKQEQFIECRTAYANFYNEIFGAMDELEPPPVGNTMGRNAWHLYSLRLRLEKLNISRAEFIEELKQRGIGASVHFIPIPLHRAYATYPTLAAHHCPNAMNLYPQLVSLPLYPAMTEDDLAYVAASVKAIIAESGSRI